MKNRERIILDALGPLMLKEDHQALTTLFEGGKTLKQDQTQLFKMEYGTRCETFGCGEQGEYMVGRPDGPLETSMVLCTVCTDSLVESVKETFNMHEKSVHAPQQEEEEVELKEAVAFELDEILSNMNSHAQLDEFIKEFDVKLIPKRDEEGGKLVERKQAIQGAFGK